MGRGKDLRRDLEINDRINSEQFNFKRKYILPDGTNFEGFDSEVLSSLKVYLQTEANTIRIDPEYYQRPEYLSLDTYGTTDLWYVLLFVNDIFSRPDFIKEEIFIPTANAIAHFLGSSIEENERTIDMRTDDDNT